jgi:hypothetical protein
MGITYEPGRFWGVLVARRGSAIPTVTKRILLMTVWSAGVCVIQHYEQFDSADGGKLVYNSGIGFSAGHLHWHPDVVPAERRTREVVRWQPANASTACKYC